MATEKGQQTKASGKERYAQGLVSQRPVSRGEFFPAVHWSLGVMS